MTYEKLVVRIPQYEYVSTNIENRKRLLTQLIYPKTIQKTLLAFFLIYDIR